MASKPRPSRAKQPQGEPRVFGGFGESKIHAAPEGSLDHAEHDWDKLTFRGEPIPKAFRSILTYAMTDQGMAEIETQIEARGGRAVTEFARDAQDKLIDKYADDLADPRAALIHTQDPLGVLMKRHLPAGKRGRWLGRKKTAEAGMIRGVVEYEAVRIPDPDNPGKTMPVTLGGMTLAAIPESLAKEAEKHYQSLELETRAGVADKVNEYNEQHVGDRLTTAATRRGKLDDLQGEVDDTPRATADLARDLAGIEV